MLKKRYAAIFLVLIVLLSIIALKPEKTTFFQVKSKFVNAAEGYTISVPEEFDVNKTFSPYAIRLVSENCAIEIYSERCENDAEKESYINYTNQAIITNNIDYFNVKEENIFGKTILFWERKKLSKIENDKNNYLKIDIPHKDRVYTVFVKSSKKITDYKKYEELLEINTPTEKNSISPDVKHSSERKFNEETQVFYDETFINSKGIEWGIYQPDFHDMPNIYYIEEELGHKFNIVLHYTDFLENYNPVLVRNVLDKAYYEGRTVELTLQPCRDSEGENTLFSVLDGKYDKFLHAYAKDVADFSHPVLFRLCNEMNGDWCEYSGYRMSLDTELYRELYRYIYDIFSEHNANNVIWIWNPNGKSFPEFEWNHESMYYPGNEYVDVLGLTLYNTGNYYEGEKWTEFEELYRPLYEKALKEYDMPFMITEFASARQGGSKEEWTEKMLSGIGNYKNIKAAVWWNGADFDKKGNIARNYYIDDSRRMKEIFRSYFSEYQKNLYD